MPPSSSAPAAPPAFDPAAHQKEVAANFRSSHLAWIALLFCATGIAEATSNFIMPDTIRHFTQNAFIISVILSMNPFFGFVAQPWAGWYSDRLWTPLGRRRPVIIVAAVCLALSCLGLPTIQHQAGHVPWLAPVLRLFGREDVSVGLALVACWNLVYQAMVDVISIMVRCLIADVVPPAHRGKAFAAANVVSVCMIFFTLRWGGTIVKGGELHWYLLVAGVVLLAVLPATFLLREPYVPPATAAGGGGSTAGYWRAVRDTPYFLRMCLVIAFTFVAGQLITNYYRLFTIEQLRLGIDDALNPLSWMPVISFVASYPVGWFADRVSHKIATMVGALLFAGAGCAGLLAHSAWDLRLMAVLTGGGAVCMEVAANAYLISFMPADKIGQLSGFANIFRGGPRFLMFFGAGALIELFGRNYRLAFGGAVLCGLVAFLLLCFMPREKHPPSSP